MDRTINLWKKKANDFSQVIDVALSLVTLCNEQMKNFKERNCSKSIPFPDKNYWNVTQLSLAVTSIIKYICNLYKISPIYCLCCLCPLFKLKLDLTCLNHCKPFLKASISFMAVYTFSVVQENETLTSHSKLSKITCLDLWKVNSLCVVDLLRSYICFMSAVGPHIRFFHDQCTV